MIRPFDLRDLPLIRRLSEQGVAMHSKAAFADGVSPLRDALLNIVSGDFPTFVYKAGGDGGLDGFIQLHQEKGVKSRAYLHYISPDVTVNARAVETAWFALLDQAVQEAGRRGIHSVVAEVDEEADALPILRQAGFAVYTRQDIYRLMVLPDNISSLPALTMQQKTDDWDVQLLYSNIVPRLVQIANPDPPTSRHGSWVLREDGELTAFVHLHIGSAATWMRLFMHPDAISSADALLTAVLQLIPGKETHPVYASVRRYQGWQQAPLERIGFELVRSQAVMARHTTRQIKRQTGGLRTSDGKRIPVSTPLSGDHSTFATDLDE